MEAFCDRTDNDRKWEFDYGSKIPDFFFFFKST